MTSSLPAHDRDLVADLATYLRKATDILGAARPKEGFGETLPLVVVLKALRTALSIVVLIERGYADEAGPLLRSLAAGTITFAALTQEESADRGYLFARHGRDRHLKWVDSMLTRRAVIQERERDLPPDQQTMFLTAEQIQTIRARIESQWNAELAAGLGGRAEPRPLGGNTRTWSGLDDATLAERVDALDIYRGIYDVASDSSHLLFPVLRNVLKELGEKKAVSIGPTYVSAAYVAMGVRDCVNRMLHDATRHFGISGRDDDLKTLDDELSAAIRRYTIPSGDQASMARARALLGADTA